MTTRLIEASSHLQQSAVEWRAGAGRQISESGLTWNDDFERRHPCIDVPERCLSSFGPSGRALLAQQG